MISETISSETYYTGGYEATHSNPTKYMANVSPASGTVEATQYGVSDSYKKVIEICDPKFDATETMVFWIDTLPTLDEHGATATPYDYEVVHGGVAKSLNCTRITVNKVDKGV